MSEIIHHYVLCNQMISADKIDMYILKLKKNILAVYLIRPVFSLFGK